MDTHSIQNKYNLHQTLTKIYPEEVKFFQFKKPLKIPKIGLENTSKLEKPEKLEKTEDQIADNRDRSLRRTLQQMQDIVKCNEFNWFATFTFDPKKHPAYDEKYCSDKMRNWLKNQQRLHGHFNYILVREPMKDGKWHFHALLGAFTGDFYETGKLRGADNHKMYKITSWQKNYGFADMEPIANKQKLTSYIMKYIQKDIDIVGFGKKRFWASNGLNLPPKRYDDELEELAKSKEMPLEITKMRMYENDFCTITTIPRKKLSLPINVSG
jgi:hypothetical protein